LIANTFHGVPNKTAPAKEINTVLQPAGRFAIINWYPIARDKTPVLGKPRGPHTEMRLSAEQTRTLVDPAGFKLEALAGLHTLPLWRDFQGGRKTHRRKGPWHREQVTKAKQIRHGPERPCFCPFTSSFEKRRLGEFWHRNDHPMLKSSP